MPSLFLCYSHPDKEFAETLAKRLADNGIEVWFDKWEIRPGDSLIQKIFAEGLASCNVFLILLSPASVTSKWVRHELDAAMVSRIAGLTRVIPAIKEQCDIPAPLRSLMWVDLSQDYESGVRAITKAVHDVSSKPQVGATPKFAEELPPRVGGLSSEASALGLAVTRNQDPEMQYSREFTGPQLKELLPNLTEGELNDAVDELEEYGLVRVLKWFGTAPYNFGQIEPTYALFLHFREAGLDYDPVEDVRAVANCVAAKERITAAELAAALKLAPLRLNRAVDYLDDYGIARVVRTLGTAPFSFFEVHAERKTRQFVQEQCR